MFREYLGEEWSEIPFSLSPISEGRVTISATRARFGLFALTADAGTLEPEVSGRVLYTQCHASADASSRKCRLRRAGGPGRSLGLLIAMLAPIILKLWYMGAVGINW